MARRLEQISCAVLRNTGYRSRYMYIAHLAKWQQGEPIGAFGGITKLDMWAADKESAVVGQLEFPAGFGGGEPFFVPSSQAASQSTDGKPFFTDSVRLRAFPLDHRWLLSRSLCPYCMDRPCVGKVFCIRSYVAS
jgi:hypothetical protein